MLDDFLTYIGEQSLFQKNERILIAVSGGIDSVVLTHLFKEANYNFAIAHCNFSLREKDSNEDQTFVQSLAKQYKVPFHTIGFNTNKYADVHKISIQMAARELRYQWFEELLIKHTYHYICTAHHHTDSIETVLFNFSKGTGISGMRGILPKKGNIIRPLLFTSKKGIQRYAENKNLIWREDTSNSSEKYHRNYIRHNILAGLEHINPSFENTAKSTLEKLKGAEEIILAAVDSAKQQLHYSAGEDHFYDINKLKSLTGKTIIIHQLLKGFGFNYHQCKDIISHMSVPGKIFLSSTYQANIDRTHVILSPLNNVDETEYLISKKDNEKAIGDLLIRFEIGPVPESIPADREIGCFDINTLSYPLTIRTWRQGDRFHPLGMTQQKKVSDFLIDTKVPLNLKDRVKVLISNNQIIWVMGHRIDHLHKISKSTTQVLQVSLKTKG